MTARQKLLVVAATVALALGLGTFEIRQATRLTDRLTAAEQSAAQARLAAAHRLADLTDENTRLRTETDRLHAEALAATQARAADTTSVQDPSLRAMADWFERVQTLKARIKAHPEVTIPEMAWLDEEDWLDAAKNNPLADENDFRRAASRLRSRADTYFAWKAYPALQSYLKTHDNKAPPDLAQLHPYFEGTFDPAILERWAILPAEEVPGIGVGDWVITEKHAMDAEHDQRIAIGSLGYGGSGQGFDPDAKVLNEVIAAFEKANPGRELDETIDLLLYATPTQTDALKRVAKKQSGKTKP